MAIQQETVASPLELPSGLTLKNRLIKAAMAEQLAKKDLPSQAHLDLYKKWGQGGWGAVMTGNVQIDPTYLGAAGDTTFPSANPSAVALWKGIASAIKAEGSAAIMQINHPGRQSPVGAGSKSFFTNPMNPSGIPLQFGTGLLTKLAVKFIFGTPSAMTTTQIQSVIAHFVSVAMSAHEAGFDGVEIHAAHGYLLSEFLLPTTNLRTDGYGGSPEKRAAIVVEIVREIRKQLPRSFTVGVKLNSADQQNDSEMSAVLDQVSVIAKEEIDFLEISGGSYENPKMIGGNVSTDVKTERTKQREAYFIDFAHQVREKHPQLTIMLTGGFRTRSGMDEAIATGACDIIGVGRPAAVCAEFAKRIVESPSWSAADDTPEKSEQETGSTVTLHPKPEEPAIARYVLSKELVRAIRGGAENMLYVKDIGKLAKGRGMEVKI